MTIFTIMIGGTVVFLQPGIEGKSWFLHGWCAIARRFTIARVFFRQRSLPCVILIAAARWRFSWRRVWCLCRRLRRSRCDLIWRRRCRGSGGFERESMVVPVQRDFGAGFHQSQFLAFFQSDAVDGRWIRSQLKKSGRTKWTGEELKGCLSHDLQRLMLHFASMLTLNA